MDSYDSRRITLDPGLTVLALRGLHHPDRHYPFIERHLRWRKALAFSSAFRDRMAAWFPTIRTLLAAARPAG